MPGNVINVFVAICQLFFYFFEFQFPSYFDYFCSTGLEFVYFLAAPSSEIQLRILLSNQLVPATKIFVCKYLGGNYHIV